jgi:hypothetical protein
VLFFSIRTADRQCECGQALKRAPFPGSIEGIRRLSRDDIFQLVPPSCALACALAGGLILLAAGNSPALDARNVRRHSYWLTRIVLLRGMGLCYLAGFLTAAFQARALFGHHGLQPAAFAVRQRPTPVFDFLERTAWGPKLSLGDWALEAVSWTGVMLSLLLLTSSLNTVCLRVCAQVHAIACVRLTCIRARTNTHSTCSIRPACVRYA